MAAVLEAVEVDLEAVVAHVLAVEVVGPKLALVLA